MSNDSLAEHDEIVVILLDNFGAGMDAAFQLGDLLIKFCSAFRNGAFLDSLIS